VGATLSGQRSGNGYGDAMAGRRADSWLELDEREQWDSALQMANDLRKAGVQNVVLMDDQKRLRIKITGGRLIGPKKP
jgi:hypothetical protein